MTKIFLIVIYSSLITLNRSNENQCDEKRENNPICGFPFIGEFYMYADHDSFSIRSAGLLKLDHTEKKHALNMRKLRTSSYQKLQVARDIDITPAKLIAFYPDNSVVLFENNCLFCFRNLTKLSH